MSRRTSRSVGKIFENFAVSLFQQAGFSVIQALRSRGPFDLYAKRGDEYYAVQIKTGRCPTPPKINIADALAVVLPDGAKRLYWYRCSKYDRHTVYEITSDGLRLTEHPLAARLPPPLDKNTVNRQRRAYEAQFTS